MVLLLKSILLTILMTKLSRFKEHYMKPYQKNIFQVSVLAQSIREILRNPEKYVKPISEYLEDE